MNKPVITLVLLLLIGVLAPNALATTIGTVSTTPGSTVIPGLVPPGTLPGTLLATLVVPFSYGTTAGTTSGFFTTAVFRESGGTLDFYYQIANNANSATSIARETDVNFGSFTTSTGFRLDGSFLSGGVFTNGTVAPGTADRSSTGAVVGFSFPISGEISPGATSLVLEISTNATMFTAGNASIIDGGSQTVAAFQPTGSVSQVPEPSSLLLLASGLMGTLTAVRRKLTV